MVACIDDHPPYQHLGSPPYGTHVDALKILAKALDKKLTYVQSPNFARCVAFLKSGQVDVIAGLNINESRKKFAFYVPFKTADKRVVISNKEVNIETYEDFYGKIIGVPRGTYYFEKFDNDSSLKKVPIHTVRTGIELLLKNRIDIIITSTYVIDTLLTDIDKAKLKVSHIQLQNAAEKKKTHFGFSKKNKLNISQEDVIFKASQAFNISHKKQTEKLK